MQRQQRAGGGGGAAPSPDRPRPAETPAASLPLPPRPETARASCSHKNNKCAGREKPRAIPAAQRSCGSGGTARGRQLPLGSGWTRCPGEAGRPWDSGHLPPGRLLHSLAPARTHGAGARRRSTEPRRPCPAAGEGEGPVPARSGPARPRRCPAHSAPPARGAAHAPPPARS